MTLPRTRTALVPALAVLAALSSCSSSGPETSPPVATSTVPAAPPTGAPPTGAAPTSTPTASSSVSPGASAPTSAPASPAPGATAQGGKSQAPTASGPQPCRTQDLTITEGGGSGGAAGSVYTAVRFVNKGAAACTLSGHPGVSFVGGADGHQVGAAADRGSEEPIGRVVLKPGGQAHATLRITQQGVYSDADCGPEPARGLRVYPPDQTASAFVAFTGGGQVACSKTSVSLLTVEPVTPGPPTR